MVPGGASWALENFKSLVTFGDSYTDEVRMSYIGQHGGITPPIGWLISKKGNSASSPAPWARYVSYYTGAQLYNYAVSGAVCSNAITPRSASSSYLFPSVAEYEIPAFVADKKYFKTQGGPNSVAAPVDDSTVYALWIGTNDLGNNALLTDSQVKGKTIADYVDCVYESFDKLYADGARYFILMNLVPLELAPQYATPEKGGLGKTQFWSDKPENVTEVSYRMKEMVVGVNELFKYRTPYEVCLANRWKGANVALYDVHRLFADIYHNPSKYLNGTTPPNVTASPPTASTSPDSYMWADALHPSQQVQRLVAQEFTRVVNGSSSYAAYWK
ncbi:hypothetical protein EJ06DRAFT_484672 [Trichodelitschia bisporula]|uniref:GDSL lipase/acylhydrolase family protein n=1 Tax=Trichodelitschia bisporula TaxID=703511 RepID=A0A6G1HIN1_9PEZI|nr:hypothetical protein EJ06DRAFT_484672 [Trichodelitschia bisporula]